MCEHKDGRLVGGVLPGLDYTTGGPSPGYEYIDIGAGTNTGSGVVDSPGLPPVLGDLTGGGSVGDAAAVVHCSAGGVSWPDTVLLYGPGPKLLGTANVDAIHPAEHANVESMSTEGRDVRVTWRTTDGCCFNKSAWTARLHWDGKTVQIIDARQTG
jgi:hypothetical protein